jgi:hypothetical protein
MQTLVALKDAFPPDQCFERTSIVIKFTLARAIACDIFVSFPKGE